MKLYVDEMPFGYTCPFGVTCDGYWNDKNCTDHFETKEEMQESGICWCSMLKKMERQQSRSNNRK